MSEKAHCIGCIQDTLDIFIDNRKSPKYNNLLRQSVKISEVYLRKQQLRACYCFACSRNLQRAWEWRRAGTSGPLQHFWHKISNICDIKVNIVCL